MGRVKNESRVWLVLLGISIVWVAGMVFLSQTGIWFGLRQTVRQAARNSRVSDNWKTPISFYGKVVDENGRSVPEATAVFLCNDTSFTGATQYTTRSDTDGRFKIEGVRGKFLGVKVEKAGFDSSRENQAGFFYAGENTNFVAAQDAPVVFRLRKKGAMGNVIESRGVAQVKISNESSVVNVFKSESLPPWQMNARLERESAIVENGRYPWKLVLEIPEGGMKLADKEFNFSAPVDGYTSSLTLTSETPVSRDWRDGFQQEFFVKANTNYGRIWIRFHAHNGSLRFRSIMNVERSRNLEWYSDSDAR
jgi:hypothetical protein